MVLRVNSPGGDAFASEKIRREVQALKEAGKRVVVSMGDVAASGGYWLAMGAEEVWASPATITGSIGVYGLLPTFQEPLERLGIHSDGIGTTEMAGKMRLDRSLDPEMQRVFQHATERTYEDFVTLVADSRRMETERVLEVAERRGTSPATVALAWLLRQDGVTAPIIGATRLDHLDDAVAAVDLQLEDDECSRLEGPYVPHPVRGHE